MLDHIKPLELRDFRGTSFGQDLDARLRCELEQLAHWRTYRAGETVLAEDEQTVFVGQVASGVLRLQRTMADGRQQIVGLLLPSEMFGRVFSHTSPFAIEAATDVIVCSFGLHEFEKLLLEHSQLEHWMFLALLDELDRARDWMVMLGSLSVSERIACFLMFLYRRQNRLNAQSLADHDIRRIDIPISRRDMAACLGTTVESICRTFRLMERKKIIKSKTPRCFEIIDKPALFRAAGLEEPSCPAGPSALGIQAPEIEPSYELKRAANFM